MGSPYSASVHSLHGSSRIDFAAFDVALNFVRARLDDPSVSRVEISSDGILLFAADESGETFAREVIAGTNH